MKSTISFLIVLLTAINCYSQSFSSLAVFISDEETGNPISSASIIVKEAGWATKTTGSDGKAFFDKSMPIGEIHYIVSKEGYQGLEGTFNITTEEKSNSLKIKLSKFRDDRLLITGEVVDDNDRDLEGAVVEVKVADIIRTAKTDASGNYKIELTLNRTQYDVSTLKLEAKCGNGNGKKVETIDLTRRNVIYKDFKLNCGKGTNPPPPPPPSLAKFTQDNWVFEVISCSQSGERVECKVRITSIGQDHDLNPNYTKRIISSTGNEYQLTEIKLSDKINQTKSFVADIPVNCVFVANNVNETIDSIAKLEVYFTIDNYSSRTVIPVFRNLKVNK